MTETTKNAAVETEEVSEQQQEKVVNKIVAKALFLSAMQSKSGKIGITIMLYDRIDPVTGQIFMSLEQKSVKGQNYTVSPVLTTWVDTNESQELLAYLKKGGLSDVYAIISGNGEFRKIHKFLTAAEYNKYLALVG